ncbi:MAG TPA: hypothetical protein PKM88_00360 [bacterium]|nr:hypothetical protein [bacterium]
MQQYAHNVVVCAVSRKSAIARATGVPPTAGSIFLTAEVINTLKCHWRWYARRPRSAVEQVDAAGKINKY